MKRKATQQAKQAIQLEEINQKVLAKEESLKRYGYRKKQYRQKRTENFVSLFFQNNGRKFYKQVGLESTKVYQRLDAKEAKQFWSKIWKRGEHNRKTELINNMEKKDARTRSNTQSNTQKKYQVRKCQTMTAYVDSSIKHSLPSTANKLLKWIGA